jgi:outer membrane protein assembly factor BamB
MRCLSPDRRLTAAALVAATVVALAACNSAPTQKPAPLTEFKPALEVAARWSVSVGNARGAFLQPAVLENVIFAAAADGAVIRVEPQSGKVEWRAETGIRIAAGVGSDGFAVAVAGSRGEVVALSAEGKVSWRAQVSSDVLTPPLVGRGLVVVRSTDQRVSAFEADSGKRRWVYQATAPALTLRAATGLSFAGDNVLVGLPGGRLIAVSLANGALRWEASITEPKGTTEVERLADVLGPLPVRGDEVCAAGYQGRITCAATAGGALRWSREISAASGVAVSPEAVYGVDARSYVHAVTRDKGASLWRNERLGFRGLTTPLALAGAVVVGDAQGYVHFLSPADGGLVGRARVDSSAIVAPPQAWGDGAVIQSQGGTLALLAPRGV